jgi:nitrogen-specific signal transduction histidine kinase
LSAAETGRNGGEQESEAIWLRLSEALLDGLQHALNNRLGTVSALAQLVEADLPPEHALAGMLSREVQRLESTVALLSAMGGSGEQPEPLQIEAILAQARELVQLHHSLREVPLEIEVQPGVLPLYVRPNLLLRSLLILLAAAGARCTEGSAILLRVTGDDVSVRITIERAGQPVGDETVAGPLSGVTARGSESLLAREGGELRPSGSVAGGYVVVLPTLPEVRRRERQA